jgi:SAM-dependent methyltransferase
MTAYDPATLDFYAAQASTYVDRPTTLHPALSAFLDRLPGGARILELGCGGGRDAAHMIARGFDVDATDGVPAMAAEAKAYLGRAVRVLRFDELDADQAYDAVVANASLLHVPTDALGGIVARVARALKPGGWHYASYKTGGDAGRDGHKRFYNRISRADAENLYRAAGDWQSLSYAATHEPGYFGDPSDWLLVTAQRAA